MTRLGKGWGWRKWAVVAALAIAPVVGGKVRGDAPEATRPTAEQAREAREIFQALRDLNGSLQAEKRPTDEDRARAATPAAADRSFTAPTLDSAALDALLDKDLVAAQAPVARTTTDEEFARRVYLDVLGTLPTPQELLGFVRERDKGKRAKLIERLLGAPDYAANWARYWSDVIQFHATNTNARQVRYEAFEGWLAGRLARNTSWDQIATEIITAVGRNDENGATVFALAQMAQPVEMAGEVSRIFLGVQIQCAQCHDHPNDPWKREQFHEFAAFFAGTKSRRAAARDAAEAKAKKPEAKVKKAVTQGLPVFEVINQPGKPRYTMPDLKDPQKQITVAPRFFLAGKGDPVPEGLSAEQRRVLAAAYVTAQDNPWFAKAFVNRIWYALMGEGFYNPVDDLGPARTPHSPEALEALASQWQQGGYNIRWLFRTILNTRAYQRESRATTTAAGRTPFASNCPSRLRADQIIEALGHALNLPLDGRGGGMGKGVVKKAAGGAGPLNRNNGPRQVINGLFGVDPSTPSDDVPGTIPQALFLMNNPQVNKAVEARNGTVLGEILTATPDNRTALDALYLRVLARHPNAKEVSICGRYLGTVEDRREAFEDILWSLINSTEFLSRR